MRPTTSPEDFESFFRTHAPAVRGYVRTLVPTDDVDHVIAATFTTAWQRFADVPTETERPWLCGVARNHARNLVRASVRRQHLDQVLASLPQISANHLHDRHLDPAHAEFVVAAMRALSPDDQEILQLLLWHDMSPTDIAQVLQLAPNVVRQRIARARTRIVQQFGAIDERGEEVS